MSQKNRKKCFLQQIQQDHPAVIKPSMLNNKDCRNLKNKYVKSGGNIAVERLNKTCN